jgi:hypothetical protein
MTIEKNQNEWESEMFNKDQEMKQVKKELENIKLMYEQEMYILRKKK